jgi:NADH-quinone oxidoreductase subunit E
MTICKWVCALIGLAAGIVVLLTVEVAETWFPTLLISLVVGSFVGLALYHLFCGGMHSHDAGAAHHDGGTGAVLTDEALREAESGARDAGAKAAAQDARIDEAIAEEAEARAREEAAAKDDAAFKARAEAAEQERKDAEKAAEQARAARSDAQEAPVPAAGVQPATLSAPHGGKGDNLRAIKGVGPKLEALLNEMGFWHFDQIAAWSDEEVAWVDANLKGFRGRVSRDNWVEQAKVLAAGGETDFSNRVSQGKVY